MTEPKSVFRFGHEAMSTPFEVVAAGRDEDYLRQAASAAFREIDRIEGILSRFDPGSDVGRINRLRPGESLRIGIETFECLTAAEDVRLETAGAFDIGFRSLIQYGWEIEPSGGGFEIRLRETEAVEGKLSRSPLELDPFADAKPRLSRRGREARLRVNPEQAPAFMSALISLERPMSTGEDAGSRGVDLGGIGKGYALEKACAVLAEWGVERALVHAGTSTAFGLGPGPEPGGRLKGWPVGVGGPWAGPGDPRSVLLADMALSGSGTEVKGAHILDPRTGRPARGHIAAWAAHPSAAVADALSTAFMVMATAEVEDFCRRHPDVWALVVADGRRVTIYNRGLLEESREK